MIKEKLIGLVLTIFAQNNLELEQYDIKTITS